MNHDLVENVELQGGGFKTLVGSKAQVWHGTAEKTSGGLRKKDLMKNKKSGRIVSILKHNQGFKALERLYSAGYQPSKGSFRLFEKKSRSRSRSRSRR